ncbi:MAG: acetylxylan esterase, partial [Kiritimatiellae bacterium]|nr:acetylxylan esterase [Kiritimatiellia bacterium]
MKTLFGIGLAATLAGSCFAEGDWVKEALEQRVLPDDASFSSYTCAMKALEAADRAADAAWGGLTDEAAFFAHGRTLRAKMAEAVGGFPAERCPLNAKTVATVQRDGYRIEKVLFESWPGVHVSALLYLPDEKVARAPYPAFIVTCGHSDNGKGSDGYQRACVQGVQQGFAALIYDPFDQGERMQIKGWGNCGGHNRLGALADLLGWSMAKFRIWDGMRAIDYLQSRPEIRADAIGYMGNSGGGTMTSLIMALEPRLKAAAPSCYLTTLRAVCASIGPQDAEQNIFGQLGFGLNHAGYVLMNAPLPVRMHCCHSDFFPFAGSKETFALVTETAKRFGLAERYGMTDVPGPHGWKESTRTSSVQWMRRWLKDDRAALPIDVEACRALDKGFAIGKVDHGLDKPDYNVTPEGMVSALPGDRNGYDLLREELGAVLKNRKAFTPEARAAVVRRCAGIAEPGQTGAKAVEAGRETAAAGTVTRIRFGYPDGLTLPAVLIEPEKGDKEAVLVVGEGVRAALLPQVKEALAAGHPVLALDLVATGEIGARKHKFYNAPNLDEEVAMLYYLLGKSLIGVRAEEILDGCAFLKGRYGTAPSVTAVGRAAIAAA